MSHTYTYPRPALTVDAVVFRERNDSRELLLIRRGQPPFEGAWALPGGFVDMDETLDEAVHRELKEETAIQQLKLEQLHTFGALDRDPRGRTVSVVYWGWLNENQYAVAGDDASEAQWFSIAKLPHLAFDHQEVIAMAINRWNQNLNKT